MNRVRGNGNGISKRADFDAIKGAQADRDRFELKLGAYVESHLDPPGSALNLKSTWVDVEGKDVLIVEVPRSKEIVHVRDPKDKGNWVVYVRSMTSTRALSGRSLTDWVRQRTST